ncbi:restriction endonuclease subunit S [Vibrio cholerae]|nr:restriction endonuclease subunit S [Vibrio cholerae]
MSSNWPTKPLGELLDLVIDHRGKTPKKMGFEDFHPTGYPVLSAKHVKTDRLVNEEAIRFANEAMYKKWMKVEVQEGDIVLTSEAPLGQVFYLNGKTKYLLGQRVFGLRPKKEEINPLYLAAWLASAKGQALLEARATGSTVLGIKQAELLKVEVDVPPEEIQELVARNRYDLVNKIDINTQTNQTLEQIAQALFKSWFVDFDPVKAKIEILAQGGSADDAELAAMGVISAKTLDELNGLKASNSEAFNKLAQTAALFPDAMQDSELGEIPEGWSVSSLSELINITGGGTPKRSEELYWNGNIPWFSVKDVPTEGNVFVVDTDEKITELGLKKSSTKLLPKGSTIITARGTVGKLALVGTDMCMNQSCYGIRGKNIGDFYNYFNLKEAVSTLQRNTHGAVFDTITTQTFDTYSMAFSGADLANKFNALVAPLLQNIEANVRQNIELASLRDTLLPKLLSGEINVTSEVVE